LVRPRRYRWWQAALFGSALSLLAALPVRNTRIYEEQRQAPFAPPRWLFGPAWTFNTLASLWGDLRLLNRRRTPNRSALLTLEGISWFVYATFGWVYFVLKSPVLAFVWTAGMYLVTILQLALARRDRRLLLSRLPVFAWLSLATPVAWYQLTHNPDPLVRSGQQRP
jgi:tryptophan-rich sensory protein